MTDLVTPDFNLVAGWLKKKLNAVGMVHTRIQIDRADGTSTFPHIS